ncbi:MAG: fasciclin domain-containing protein [Bacteroidota bacterium]|nr:fasciclin domain-containing protein [Bacteroidota bacterium]
MSTKTFYHSKFPIIAGALFILFSFSSCKKNHSNPPPVSGNITAIVSNTPEFSILKAAVVKAGLTATLSGKGPFTVFAPNNDAFMASGITLASINSLSADDLKAILLYHTIGASVKAMDVPAGPNAAVATVGGDSVFLTKNLNGVFVNGVPVVKADIIATNGIIHVISRVLMPPPGNIVEVAQSDSTFSYLVAAVLRASQGNTNVAQVLSSNGPFTVFAPTNNAFRNAGFATINDINNADPNTLATILTYHVISGRIFSSDLSDGAQPTTLNGGQVTIGLINGATVKGSSNTTLSNIINTNIVATNGVVHVIDQVLLP